MGLDPYNRKPPQGNGSPMLVRTQRALEDWASELLRRIAAGTSNLAAVTISFSAAFERFGKAAEQMGWTLARFQQGWVSTSPEERALHRKLRLKQVRHNRRSR